LDEAVIMKKAVKGNLKWVRVNPSAGGNSSRLELFI